MSTWDELIEDARADIADADRCKALGIQPAAYQLHRRLREVTNALALEREALLSDEVVERAAWGIHEFHDRGDWEHEPAEVLDEYLDIARAAMTAAIEGEQ